MRRDAPASANQRGRTSPNARRSGETALKLCEEARRERAAGHLEAAASLLERAIRRHRTTGESVGRSAFYDLAHLLTELGKPDAAEAAARAGLDRLGPDFALRNLLGFVLNRLGRHDEAIESLEEARRLDPRNVSPIVHLGNVQLARGKVAEAVALFREAVAAEPERAEFHRLLAGALHQAGDAESALVHYRRAAALAPDDDRPVLDAARILGTLARSDEALDLLKERLARRPDDRSVGETMGYLLRQAGRHAEAAAFADDLAARFPTLVWIRLQQALAIAPRDQRLANERLRTGLALDPSDLDCLVELAESLDRTRGPDEAHNIDEAYRLAQRRLELGGLRGRDAATLRSIFNRACDYDSAEALGSFDMLGAHWARTGQISALHHQLARVTSPRDRRRLVDFHRAWGRRVDDLAHATPLAAPAVRTRRARLKLGLMSSDLRHHPVSYFALPLIEGYDRTRLEIVCYSWSSLPADPVQTHIASRVDAFRHAPGLSDRDSAALIAADGLDMLIELGGTTHMNKLRVMAWRPAPVQASWLGYPHSSGLGSIDSIIVDPFNCPPDPALLIEKPLILARSWVVLGRLGFGDAVSIEPLTPEARKGHLTFGTMNNPYKYTRSVFAAWAAVLRQVERSRFLFVRPEGATPGFTANIRHMFADHGVDPARIDFVAVRGTHLQHYNDIDIALDTFPQTGGTTTCESLWMGCPTVTLVGEALYERLSYSNLVNAGLADLCAYDADGFVRIAVGLAEDATRRAELRTSLRQDIRRRALGRTDWFVDDFQFAVRRAVDRAFPGAMP